MPSEPATRANFECLTWKWMCSSYSLATITQIAVAGPTSSVQPILCTRYVFDVQLPVHSRTKKLRASSKMVEDDAQLWSPLRCDAFIRTAADNYR